MKNYNSDYENYISDEFQEPFESKTGSFLGFIPEDEPESACYCKLSKIEQSGTKFTITLRILDVDEKLIHMKKITLCKDEIIEMILYEPEVYLFSSAERIPVLVHVKELNSEHIILDPIAVAQNYIDDINR